MGMGKNGRAEGVHRKEESMMFYQDLLCPMEMVKESEERSNDPLEMGS